MRFSPHVEKRLRHTSVVFLLGWVVAVLMLVWGKDVLPPLVSRLFVVAIFINVVYCVVVGGSAIAESSKELKRAIFEPQPSIPANESEDSRTRSPEVQRPPALVTSHHSPEESKTSHANNAR